MAAVLLAGAATLAHAQNALPTVGGGRVVLEIGARAGTQLSLPTDVAVGPKGQVYVVDSGRHRVSMYDAAGQPLGHFGGAGKGDGQLQGPVVGTVMSNLGLEHALRAQGIPFLRAPVGDRYVLELLRKQGGVIGGETSGHLLCLDRTTTGDGLVSALQVLAVMKRTGRSLAELTAAVPRFPQVMVNVRVRERVDPKNSPAIQADVRWVEQALGGSGRVVLRASGMEPLIRVMVEGQDEALVTRYANELAETVRQSV